MRNAALIILASICFSACKKESQYTSTANIIGIDARMGPCTGGIFILIDGHPNPNHSNGLYDINEIPSSFKIHFPQKVSIDWQLSSKCFGNYVDITRIKNIN